jgi:hypothetical protein
MTVKLGPFGRGMRWSPPAPRPVAAVAKSKDLGNRTITLIDRLRFPEPVSKLLCDYLSCIARRCWLLSAAHLVAA